jgi:predicted PurR-regulated permease PerM
LFSLGLCLGLVFLLFKLLWPHAGALIGAIALGVSFFPLHRRLENRWRRRSPSLRAAAMTLLVLFFFLTPLLAMAWAALDQADSWNPAIGSWRETITHWRDGTIVDSSPAMKDFRGWAQKTFDITPRQLRRRISGYADGVLDSIGGAIARFSAGLASSVAETALMAVILFFVFRDGESFYQRLQEYLPLSEGQKTSLRERAFGIVTGVIRGWLLSAVVQGVLAMAAYAIAGIKGWVLFGFVTMMAGLLPFIGTAFVWIPLGINRFMTGSPGAGTFLLIWGVFIVSLVDNLLHPYLTGQRVKVPFILLLLSFLGGIEVWGLKGIILGPVLVALAPVVFESFHHREDQLPLLSGTGKKEPVL